MSGLQDTYYKDLTDEELSFELMTLIYGFDIKHWSTSDCGDYIFDGGVTGDSYQTLNIINYCKDWNELMPLVVELGIEYHKDGKGIYKAARYLPCYSTGDTIQRALLECVYLCYSEKWSLPDDKGGNNNGYRWD